MCGVCGPAIGAAALKALARRNFAGRSIVHQLSRPFESKNRSGPKIPASCRSRPPHHLFAPGEADRSNLITKIIIDNVNAFSHRSSEAGRPFANRDLEDLFYSVDARNVRCRLDERAIGSVVRCNTSYTVVDFETGGNAMAAFKMFQGRMAYASNGHLRLQFVGAKGRTFGMRMGSVYGSRGTERRRGEGIRGVCQGLGSGWRSFARGHYA